VPVVISYDKLNDPSLLVHLSFRRFIDVNLCATTVTVRHYLRGFKRRPAARTACGFTLLFFPSSHPRRMRSASASRPAIQSNNVLFLIMCCILVYKSLPPAGRPFRGTNTDAFCALFVFTSSKLITSDLFFITNTS